MSSVLLSSSSSSSTGQQLVDSSVESGHIAAIIVCMIIGLSLAVYACYRLAKRYCPNLLLAITPQDTLTSKPAPSRQPTGYEQQAAEMAAHMAAPADVKGEQQAVAGKKGDSHVVDMEVASPLSINEQWTVRDEPAHDDDS